MSEIDLEGIRARVDKATPGPWKPDPGASAGEDYELWFARGPMIKAMGYQEGKAKVKADADFVAHARTDVPLLCAEVERLRKIEAALGSIGFLNTVYRLLKNGHATIVREERLAFEGLLEAIAPSNVDGADGSERVVEMEEKP